MQDTAPPGPTVDRNIQIIAGAMLLGVVMFIGVAGFLKLQGMVPLGTRDVPASLFGGIAISVAVVSFLVSFVVGPLLAGSGEHPGRVRLASLVRLALNEGGAMLGIVMFLITGELFLPGLATGIGLIGLALSFPR
jgi:hypothetical protein